MVHYQVGRKDFSFFNEIREMEQFSSVTQTRQEQPNGWVVLVIHGHLIDLLLKAFLGIVSWQVNWHLSGNWGSLWGTCIPPIKHFLSFENNGPSNLRARHLEKQNSCKSPMRTKLKFLCVKCCFFFGFHWAHEMQELHPKPVYLKAPHSQFGGLLKLETAQGVLLFQNENDEIWVQLRERDDLGEQTVRLMAWFELFMGPSAKVDDPTEDQENENVMNRRVTSQGEVARVGVLGIPCSWYQLSQSEVIFFTPNCATAHLTLRPNGSARDSQCFYIDSDKHVMRCNGHICVSELWFLGNLAPFGEHPASAGGHPSHRRG